MNRKAMIEDVCDYILSQDHEWEDMILEMMGEIKDGFKRQDVKQTGRNRIWYVATCLLYGKREAEKGLTEAYREALGALKQKGKQ